jgi:hypothetical protein
MNSTHFDRGDMKLEKFPREFAGSLATGAVHNVPGGKLFNPTADATPTASQYL